MHGDAEKVALGVVDFLEIGVVANGLDSFLQGNYLVVTYHHGLRPELQAVEKAFAVK